MVITSLVCVYLVPGLPLISYVLYRRALWYCFEKARGESGTWRQWNLCHLIHESNIFLTSGITQNKLLKYPETCSTRVNISTTHSTSNIEEALIQRFIIKVHPDALVSVHMGLKWKSYIYFYFCCPSATQSNSISIYDLCLTGSNIVPSYEHHDISNCHQLDCWRREIYQ